MSPSKRMIAIEPVFLRAKLTTLCFQSNVFSFKKSQVSLRRAEMPGQLVKRLPFRILLASNNGLMFLPSDGAFVLELNFRPLPFHNHRPRQPRHIEGEVMDAPQINVGRNFSNFEHTQEMFRSGFQNRQMPDRIECLVLDCGAPAVLGFVFLSLTISSTTNCQLRVAICGSLAARYARAICKFTAGCLVASLSEWNNRTAVARSLVPRLSCLPVTSS